MHYFLQKYENTFDLQSLFCKNVHNDIKLKYFNPKIAPRNVI